MCINYKAASPREYSSRNKRNKALVIIILDAGLLVQSRCTPSVSRFINAKRTEKRRLPTDVAHTSSFTTFIRWQNRATARRREGSCTVTFLLINLGITMKPGSRSPGVPHPSHRAAALWTTFIIKQWRKLRWKIRVYTALSSPFLLFLLLIIASPSFCNLAPFLFLHFS